LICGITRNGNRFQKKQRVKFRTQKKLKKSYNSDTQIKEQDKITSDVVYTQLAQVTEKQQNSSMVRHHHVRYVFIITKQGGVLLMHKDELLTYQWAST
jgi:hypothetical protein